MNTKAAWQVIDGLPTYVIQRGKISSDKPLLLIIPGNPGVADFYKEFMENLAKESNDSLPMVCISHAGHVTVPKHLQDAGRGFPDKWLTVQDQVNHKLAFIKSNVPTNTPLIFVGHSIGCYMILQMMKLLEKRHVLRSFLLFPTIERLSQTSSGRVVTPLLQYFRWLLPMFTYPMYYLVPDAVKRFLVKFYFRNKLVPRCAVEGVLKLASPLAVGCFVNLAHDEMQVVQEAQYDLLQSYIDQLYFYYGANDHWCPVEFYKEMKERFPDANVHLCECGMEHAFVLESSSEMAVLLWQWIQTGINH